MSQCVNATYSISQKVLDDFNKLCDPDRVNKSALIEKMMVNWIAEQKKGK